MSGFFICTESLTAQTTFCGFDDRLDQLLDDQIELMEIMDLDENVMQTILQGNGPSYLPIMSNTVYTVPVVVHVIHLGTGHVTNISDTQIYSAIDQLNDDFANLAGTGVDIGIQFCLAQQDPSGNPTTGIIRVNGTNTCAGGNCYENYGIASSGALEYAVKNLSIWPNQQYYNIWVVSEIDGNDGEFTGTQAYANMAFSQPIDLDGTVILYNAFGTTGTLKSETDLNKILAHEIGHAFNLFHTFQGDCGGSCCPLNEFPAIQGDRCIDTPPHKRSNLGCTSGTNSCDGNSSDTLFVHNHMEYSDESCRNRFTSKQRERMRCALLDIRSGLANSVGCLPVCIGVTSSFTSSDTIGIQGITLEFVNTSTGHDSSVWYVNNTVILSEDLEFEFNSPDLYNVCLRVFGDGGCAVQYCRFVSILPGEPCFSEEPVIECQLLFNGNLEQHNVTHAEHGGQNNANIGQSSNVCNWRAMSATPFFCYEVLGSNSMGLYSNAGRPPGHLEGVLTSTPLDLIDGNRYKLTFEYIVGNIRGATDDTRSESLIVGLTNETTWCNTYNAACILAHENDQIITSINSPLYDFHSFQNFACVASSHNIYRYHEAEFVFENTGNYLYILNKGNLSQGSNNVIFVKNITVTDCDLSCFADPDFTIYQQDCRVGFTGTNEEDPGEYHWTFGDGTSGYGAEITHDYIYTGDFEVCLTIACNLETSYTYCDTVYITNPECDLCETFEIEIESVLCEESDSLTNSYLANFEIEVDKGFKPCIEGDLFVSTPDATTSVTSYLIDTTNSTYDIIKIALLITPDSIDLFETNGATGHITLCGPEGEFICYNFTATGQTCDRCLDITLFSIAECNDPEPNDDLLVYRGVVEIDLSEEGTEGFTYCGASSTESGFVDYITPLGSDDELFELVYTIDRTQKGPFSSSALLCFIDNFTDEKLCISLNIIVDAPCITEEPPTNCPFKWFPPKEMECVKVVEGYSIFNFAMNVHNNGYKICDGGLWGTVDGGGYVEVVSGTTPGHTFSFNIDIAIPCDFEESDTFTVRLYLCDSLGVITCFEFPFLFNCGLECDRGMEERLTIIADPVDVRLNYSLYPNPANQSIRIVRNDKKRIHLKELEISNLMGLRVHKIQNFSLDSELDVSELTPGTYIVRITGMDDVSEIRKLIIIK
ncbi:MAG: T9SS type A sorting domain-containing protein [Saprospiraceae bacterium]|nr:T9SS type A sorting domain-containing protein [Saprospiraceae bacterium]